MRKPSSTKMARRKAITKLESAVKQLINKATSGNLLALHNSRHSPAADERFS